MVCLLKSEGGLGVLNLQTHNDALLLKHLHKFFQHTWYSLGKICTGKTLQEWQTT